uniref:Gamma-aminobutyric acid type B receptor subunit 2 n=1 Tax=Elaeophora elaphi TaxID=1147741 RepID=A0A0R3RG66_9BILA
MHCLTCLLLMAQISLGYTQDCRNLHRVNRIPLTIGVFLPYQYKHVLEPAVNTALEHIHNQSCILKDYYLKLHFEDTECKTSFGMKALFELMNDHPRPFALFGDACTNVNEVVAMASKYWHILHLSYAERHAKFASADAQAMYPTFFRMVPGYQNSNLARCHLIFQFNWTRVGTLKQSDDARFALVSRKWKRFKEKPHESLTTRLEHGFGIRVIYTAGITRDEIQNIGYELNELKKRDARILIGDFEESLAVRILCEAYQNGIYGDNYAWILPGYHKSDWWRNASEVSCTVEELAQVIEGHFAVEFSPYSQRLARVTIANKTVSAIRAELDARQGSSPESVYKGYVYDGLWTLALAIENVAQFHQERDGTIWMPNVSDTEDWTGLSAELLQAVSGTSFIGVTGPVRFENNERLGLVEILQWRNGSYMIAGIFDGTETVLTLNPALEDWRPPLDATVVVRERQYISFVLFILLSLLAIIGVAIAVFFLIINIRYQNHRYIKMSSPNMNNLIIAGSICTYISVILLGFDTRFVSPDTFVTLCYAKTWVLSLGFTLAFGSMFSKTWRVHSIFKNIRMNKKAIKDYKLFMLVGFIALVDLISLTLWARISPFTFHVYQLAIFYSDNKMIAPEIERCRSDNSVIFEAIILGIKGLLMLLGCFLAWETRQVNVPALNDSKYIGMSVYSVVVTCLLGLPLVYILKDRVNEAHILGSLFIIICTTLILCLVFVPKIVELLRNPQGTELRYRRGLVKSSLGQSDSQRIAQNNDETNVFRRENLQRLEEENVLLHRYLLQKTSLLWELQEKLKQLGELVDDAITPSDEG